MSDEEYRDCLDALLRPRITPEEAEAIQAYYRLRFSGPGNAHRWWIPHVGLV